jgi:hypothetical protein
MASDENLNILPELPIMENVHLEKLLCSAQLQKNKTKIFFFSASIMQQQQHERTLEF